MGNGREVGAFGDIVANDGRDLEHPQLLLVSVFEHFEGQLHAFRVKSQAFEGGSGKGSEAGLRVLDAEVAGKVGSGRDHLDPNRR